MKAKTTRQPRNTVMGNPIANSGAQALAEPSATDFARIYRSAPIERIMMIRRGVPAGDVLHLAKIMGRPKERLFSVLGLPRATIDRKARASQRLSVEQGERVIGFSKLVGQVQVMVEQSGDPVGFDAARWLADWLDSPLPALDGQCPADYLDTVEGQEFVSSLLGKMQSGAYL